MEKITKSIFDFFSFLVPGLLYLLGLLILGKELVSDNESAIDILKDFSSLFYGAVIFFSYILGFIGSILSRAVFKWYLRLIYLIFKELNSARAYPPKSLMYIYAREYSLSNFEAINKWNSLMIFSYNIALSVFILGAICLIKISSFGFFPFLLFIAGGFVLLEKGREYRRWRNNDLRNLYDFLKLVKNIPEKQ